MATQPSPESFYKSIPIGNAWKLDRKLDFEHSDVQIHLGKIAASMDQWEGRVADELELTKSEVADIKLEHSGKLNLQTRAALQKWQEKFGPEATYKNLITAFLNADKGSYAEAVCEQLRPLDNSDKSVRQCDHIEDSSHRTEEAQHEHGDTALKDEPKSQPSCSGATFNTPSDSSPKATPQETQFPFLNVDSLSEDQRENLEDQLLSDTRAITLKFAHLQEVVESSLCDRNVLPERLANCVLRITGVYSDVVPMLKEHEDELKKATSVSKIFLILTDYISFFNYEILDHIVKTLGTENDKSEFKQYLTHFQKFCKRSVFEVPPNSFGGACTTTEKRQKLVMKMTGNAKALMTKKHPTLSDICGAKIRIAHIVGITSSSLYLCRVDEGCVEMLFLVPRWVFEPVHQKLFNEDTIAELSLYGITVCHERTSESAYSGFYSLLESARSVLKSIYITVTEDQLSAQFSRLQVSGKPDYRDLCKELLHHGVENHMIELGWLLEMETLKYISIMKKNYHPVECLRRLFGRWLRRDDPHPTWSAIIKAVSILGYKDLAEHLQQRYVSHTGQSLPHAGKGITEVKSSAQFSLQKDSSGRPDFRVLYKELLHYKIQHTWLELGGLLGVPGDTMRNWKKELESCETALTSSNRYRQCYKTVTPHPYKFPQVYLRRLLLFWLNRDDPPPTWSAMFEVLDKLGEKELTEKLRQKYLKKKIIVV